MIAFEAGLIGIRLAADWSEGWRSPDGDTGLVLLLLGPKLKPEA